MMSAFGMFNALVMSYSRLPLAMALDGMLPKIFGKTTSAQMRRGWPFWFARHAGRFASDSGSAG